MLRAIAILFSLTFLAGPLLAQSGDASFKHDGVARDATRYEEWLKKNWRPIAKSSQASRASGYRILAEGQDPRGASRAFAQAVVNDPRDAAAWIGLARALLAIPKKNYRGSERYTVSVNASAAAYVAYQRSNAKRQRAEALAVTAEALARRSYWRPALDAYKTSLAIQGDAAIQQAYDALRAERGFRVVNYEVENETATPRLCVIFSEPLKRGKIDFAKYIAVNGRDPEGVNAEGSQLCIDGLAHGERFEIAVRAGLPADVDDQLAKGAELTVYVRDRSPTVRFGGRSYVLPSRGQSGIPVVSINTREVEVKIFRIGDRGLVSAVANGTVDRQLSRWELRDLASKNGQKVYEGRLAVRSVLNKEVTTAVPVSDAIPKMTAGVYALVASASEGKQDRGNIATQWFVVSDIGLTALSGAGGVHAFVRSLATTAPISSAKVRLLARNNDVLGELTTDKNGYARFPTNLSKGEGGLAPALLIAEGSNGDYAFLNMATAAFDLTDRGVKGRVAPGPVDGYVYTERGVYRPGEEVNLTALIRDQKGRASGVPVTTIVVRPDGVEHKRFAMRDQGNGGRTAALALSASAMTGRGVFARTLIQSPILLQPRHSSSRTSCRNAWRLNLQQAPIHLLPASRAALPPRASFFTGRRQQTSPWKAKSSSVLRNAMSRASPAIDLAQPTNGLVRSARPWRMSGARIAAVRPTSR